MSTALEHPANESVIRQLCPERRQPELRPAGEGDSPYWRSGAHPDVVERVWDQLGAGLPSGARQLLCGTPVLVAPASGVILAFCMGTAYCLRVPAKELTRAREAGCATRRRWSDGRATDLSRELGSEWVFGCNSPLEREWVKALALAGEGAPAR